MTHLSELIQNFEARWPFETAEDWDKPGLLLGSPNQPVKKVLLSVDVTAEVLAEAIQMGAELIFSHHPMFLRGVHELAETGFRGKLVAEANRNSIAVYCAHTNADGVEDGVTDSLAKKIGLLNLESFGSNSNHGRVGQLPQEMSLIELARVVGKAIPATASGVRVAGEPNTRVRRVAVMGGAGDSFLATVRDLQVDAYVTSDLRHHPAQEFMQQSQLENNRPALIDISHWAAEWVWLDGLANSLKADFPSLEFIVSEIRTDPWDFAVMQ